MQQVSHVIPLPESMLEVVQASPVLFCIILLLLLFLFILPESMLAVGEASPVSIVFYKKSPACSGFT